MSNVSVERVDQNADFERIVPVVERYAAACIRCPDLRGMAVTLAWWAWHVAEDKRHLPASVWARAGVRHALAGRDIPGLRSRTKDAFDMRDVYQGAGMSQMADRRPGPLKQVIMREEAVRLFESLDPFEQQMCDMLAAGVPNQDVARRLGRTPGAISQRRRRLMERSRAG